ncbi:Zinc finger protein 384 [Papilio machaon]|uniref:Zinc finger protein 384 n=1 Tax=Papilio machaon TaxID=76193 RepID=A0A194QKA0_PAPMA|nr:Zinc finger protein 384 [Papilio machaon]
MDRLNQLRSEAGGSGDSSLDTSSAASEAYLTANENSKYFSLLEDEASFNIAKDVNSDQEAAVADNSMISNLSPISKSSDLDSYKIGKQIEASNILFGSVNIFEDNENSYDGDELVIDDNAPEIDEKGNLEDKIIEDVQYGKVEDNLAGNIDDVEPAIPSKDTEVVLQIDGKNVDAIDIGNGLYLYRKEGEEELAAVQIVNDDQQQSSFKFLKVRENTEGNLEVYEEIEIEVPKEVPVKEGKTTENVSHIPIKDINKVISEPTKVDEKKITIPQKETSTSEINVELSKESQSDSKSEVNLNGKMMKFSESRKSPVVGSFTPMTYHSTPNKEGIPLTKTMVDQQLHPSRHSDNVKKTIEVHTDSSKQKNLDSPVKHFKEICDVNVPVIPDKDSKQTPEENNDINETLSEKNNVVEKLPEKNLVENQDTTVSNEDKEENMIKKGSEVSKSDTPAQKDEITNEEIIIKETPKNVNQLFSQNEEIIKQIPNDTNNTSIVKNNEGIVNCVDVKDTSKDKVESKVETIEKSKEECGIMEIEQTVVNKKIEEIQTEQSITVESNSETKLDKEIKSSTISNNSTFDATVESVKDIPVTMQEATKDSVKLARDKSQLQNIEIDKALKIAPLESKTLTSDETGMDQNIQSTIDLPKQNLIQQDTKHNKKEDQDKSKIIIEKKQEEGSNHKMTESNIIAPQPVELKGKCKTFESHGKIQLNVKNETKKEISKITKHVGSKAVNNNNAAVPFGKWTEANRQEFLNKIKETKVTTNSSNTKQIKQPNDLNRRDVLQKIDSQRQQTNNAMAKVQEQQKLTSNKNETAAFVKSAVKHDSKQVVKDRPTSKTKSVTSKKASKDDSSSNHQTDSAILLPISHTNMKELLQRREINNQALIDKTVEEIINRVPPAKTTNKDRTQNISNMEGVEKQKGMTLFGPSYHANNNQPVTLDEIETKMNELHGIPFVERPAHELPQKFVVDNILSLQNDSPKNKSTNQTNLLSQLKNTVQHTNEIVHIDSDEEIIEHEPITGDVNLKKIASEHPKEAHDLRMEITHKASDESKKEVIITEKDFDKFYRRNSVTYENCLTVNLDGKETHNVVQTTVEKDIAPKKLTRNEVLLAESKAKSTHKQQMLQARHSNYHSKIPVSNKHQTSEEETYGKNYQSKVQIAYHTALTAKRQKESPITIIEEKPVKVVFMDSSVDFVPSQLNVQGEKLSPIKQFTPDLETFTHSTTDSLDSDMLDNFDNKTQEETKTKSKHQRKQVLTPVEAPEMELIQSDDLGIEISPKKKRRIEDKLEKSPKNHVPKKSYLLGRTNADEKNKTTEVDKVVFNDINNHTNSYVAHPNPISAIDNLVKAAELLENQAEISSSSIKTQESETQQQTPPKRGRGRPRKYPLTDADSDKSKAPSPQKKPRLMDAKAPKSPKVASPEQTEEDDASDDRTVKENWTMGKINEKILCPICNKLFRNESVVYKHVKHCTGPSPNRPESDTGRLSESQESENKSHASKSDDVDLQDEETPKKRKSEESVPKVSVPDDDIIEETVNKEKTNKQHESRKSIVKTKNVSKPNNNLVCEICGKSFRHLSYLAHHKLQHKNEDSKKNDSEANVSKSVFCCEICKKEFRKLHHLVQHRIIHNPSSMSTRTLRKSSSEQGDNKIVKEQSALKQTEDHSAGFRCEPCDKSFRKLHHLVEHRETHDGINRQKAIEVETPKPAQIYQCDICDKTFKKLQLLNEHKEQHLETCSEKSDDKSVKSSFSSTKDIIHECSLCYMVFPNELSLNKHTEKCLRKKKQSIAKAKQAALNKELEGETLDTESRQSEECLNEKDDSLIIVEDNEEESFEPIDIKQNKPEDDKHINDIKVEKSEADNCNNADALSREQKDINSITPIKQDHVKKSTEAKEKELEQTVTETVINKEVIIPQHIPSKIKNDENLKPKVNDTLVDKKKNINKEKVIPTITKRKKSLNAPVPVVESVKPSIESSDEDDVRYMLNPDFKEETSMEEKSFMKIKTKKRNSLHFERPSSRDLLKRRISMQLPLKTSRLKKSTEQIAVATTSSLETKSTPKANEKPTTATDSDDSDTKYAFPETVKDTPTTSEVKKPQKRKSIATKRKLLSGVVKRKSLGKPTKVKHKLKPEPVKPIKKRTTEVEHRCDCGKLFSSAALLSRHTTLDHTPPRSRRRRSPPPEVDTNVAKVTKKTPPKKIYVKQTVQPKKVENDNRKSGVATRKSTTNNNDAKPSRDTRKSLKHTPAAKTPNMAAHKGVPVPDELRKHVAKQHLKNK